MNNILIKTYTFESGLWYLAKSLGDLLKNRGCNVYYIPKSKYILEGRVFRRKYLKPENIKDFEKENILEFTTKKSIESQISEAIKQYNIDTIFSFETLMQKAGWVNKVKESHDVSVIDIPMIEWVTESYLKNGSYNMFEQIWCLTNQCYKHFNKYPNAIRTSWPLVDENIFYPPSSRSGTIVYYHAGSLNPDHSTKNTNKVISAFNRFLKEESPDAKLYFTGAFSKKFGVKNPNIIHVNQVINREEIGKIYRGADVVIAPSEKEGLGLSLHEAAACDCKIITTDASPMNETTASYLCRVYDFKDDRSFIPLAQVKESEIYKQIKQSYKDIIDGRRQS